MTLKLLQKKKNVNEPDKYGCIFYCVRRIWSGSKSWYKRRAYAQYVANHQTTGSVVTGYNSNGIIIYEREYL